MQTAENDQAEELRVDVARRLGRLVSPLGAQVAKIVDDLVGLHNYPNRFDVDWSNPFCIELRWSGSLSTFDFNNLTRLVLLAHDRCVRVEIAPRSHRYLTLLFHQRAREGYISQRHPTAEGALAEHRQWYPAPEEACVNDHT